MCFAAIPSLPLSVASVFLLLAGAAPLNAATLPPCQNTFQRCYGREQARFINYAWIVFLVNPVSHVAKSRLLEDIILELRRKGMEIPANVMSDLKSARTLMKLEKTDAPIPGESEPKIDKYLATVEAYLMSEADKHFSAEQVQRWMAGLDLASCDTCVTVTKRKEEMRMVPGVPRDQKLIRVEPIDSLPMEKLEKMAADAKLGYRRDKDIHLIVFGSEEDIKSFVKKMTEIANQKGK